MGSDWIYFLTFPIFLWLNKNPDDPTTCTNSRLLRYLTSWLFQTISIYLKKWRIHEYTDMHSAVSIFSPKHFCALRKFTTEASRLSVRCPCAAAWLPASGYGPPVASAHPSAPRRRRSIPIATWSRSAGPVGRGIKIEPMAGNGLKFEHIKLILK